MTNHNVIVLDSGTQVTENGQTLHALHAEANNCLWSADSVGVAVFARQAPEFADDHSDDTVIVVLRGKNAVAAGREALVAVADLIRNA